MTRRILHPAWLAIPAVTWMLLSGCGPTGENSDSAEFPASPAMQRALSIDVRPFNEAFSRVTSEPHVADRFDVVQGRSEDEPLTSRARLIFDGRDYTEVSRETTGSLPDCRICSILGRSTPADASAIERFFVDADAPFLSQRSAHAFEYAEGPDTLVDGNTLQSIRIRAIDDDPRAGRYRAVTLFVDPRDETLAGLDVESRRETFFIREGGHRSAFIDRTSGHPFPRNASIIQDVRVLMGGERVIHTEIRYSSDAGARSPS